MSRQEYEEVLRVLKMQLEALRRIAPPVPDDLEKKERAICDEIKRIEEDVLPLRDELQQILRELGPS